MNLPRWRTLLFFTLAVGLLRFGLRRPKGRKQHAEQEEPRGAAESLPIRYEYDAFGSYSTGADYRLVRRVEGFLESFHELPKPAGDPLPKLEICVDGSDFSVARAAASARRQPGVTPARIEDEIQRLIVEKLGGSRRLLLFCPGRERQGPWMDWEIAWWDRHRGWDSVFIGVTGGRDPWGEPEKFFPKKVIEHGLHRRIGYDLRGHRRRWQRRGWKGVRDFDEELARLAADLYDRSLGEVQPVWFRERRRSARRAARIAATVAVTTLLLAAFALVQRHVAEERRLVAERQTRLATARQLAAQSSAALAGGFPQRSLLLGIEALRVTQAAGEPRVIDAEQALRAGLARVGGTVLRGHTEPVWTLAASPDGRWFATGSEDGRALLWDPAGAGPLPLGEPGSAVEQVHFSPDGRWLATAQRDGTVKLWDLLARDIARKPAAVAASAAGVVKTCFSSAGRWLAATREDDTITLLDLHAPAEPPRILERHRNPVTDLAWTPDEARLITASDKQTNPAGTNLLRMEGAALVWDLRDAAAEPQVLRGHDGAVVCLCVAPGGRWLLTGGSDGAVIVWDLAAQPVAEARRLAAHAKGVAALAIAPGGRWAVSGGYDAEARLWDLEGSDPARESIALGRNSGTVLDVEFSSDGRWLLTHGTKDSGARLWDMAGSPPAARSIPLHGHGGLIQVAHFSGDARWLLTAGDDKTARLWDLKAADPAAAALVFAGHEDPVAAAAISADGRWLALASGTGDFLLPRRDCTARVWDLRALQPAASPELLAVPGEERGGAIVQEGGAWIATPAADGKVRLWRRGDRAAFLLDAGSERLSEITFSRDGRWLAVASEDGAARLLDLTRPDPAEKPFLLESGANALLHAAFSPDSRWLATGDNESAAILWDLRAPDPSQAGHPLRGHGDGITALVWSCDSRRLITTGSNGDRTARVWDTSAAAPAAPLWTLGGHEEAVNLAALSPDGRWLTTTEQYRGAVRVWDLQAANPESRPAFRFEHGSETQALAISPDGRWLASAGRSEGVKLHPLPPAPGAGVTLPEATADGRDPALAFSPDGRWLAFSGTNDTALLWNLRERPLAPIPLRGHGDDVTHFAFAPDGAQLLTGSADGTMRIWSIEAPLAEPPVVLPAGAGELLSLEVSTDGRWAITGAADGIRLWPLGVESLNELARRFAGRELRPNERAAYLPQPQPATTGLRELLREWWSRVVFVFARDRR